MRLRFPRLRTLKWLGFSGILLLTGLWVFLWNYDVGYYWGWGTCGTQDTLLYCYWADDVDVKPGVSARQTMQAEGWFVAPGAPGKWGIQRRSGVPIILAWPTFNTEYYLHSMSIPMSLPWLTAALLTAALFFMDRRWIPKGHCKRCGYNLMGNVSGTCPECGERADYRVPFLARVGRAFYYCSLALATLIAGFTAVVCYASRSSAPPRIIAAVRSQEGIQLFKPLGQLKVGVWSKLFDSLPRYNWDGKYLNVTGDCPRCWKPGAKPGAFVLAKLPSGLAYATHQSPKPGHAHLSKPKPIPLLVVFALGISLAALIAFGPLLIYRLIKRYTDVKKSPEKYDQQAGVDEAVLDVH